MLNSCKSLLAVTLAGSSVAFAEHKAFQEKYIIGCSTEQIATALQARQLSTRRLEFPFSDARRLAQAIPFEIEAETPFDLDDIIVDWNILAAERQHGTIQRVHGRGLREQHPHGPPHTARDGLARAAPRCLQSCS